MKTIITIITLCVLLISNIGTAQSIKESKKKLESFKKIKVLNVGVFHMGNTSDANSTKYDEKAKEAKKHIKEITQAIAKFKPTIILVERTPKYQNDLEENYQNYLKNVNAKTSYENNEIQLLGFEIGKLSNTKRIYGIDNKISYKYNLNELAKKMKVTKFFKIVKRLDTILKKIDLDVNKIGLKKMLLSLNSDITYDFLINYNADRLMYVNSKDCFEGADEATKFYKRNIRMFANINKVEMNENDRVLIISGGTHAAFFNKFMSRSLIYELVPLSDYLK